MFIEIFIISEDGFSIGVYRARPHSVIWAKSVEERDPFAATHSIILEAFKESTTSFSILADFKSSRDSIVNPNLSPWTSRFQARKLLLLFSNAGLAISPFLYTEANNSCKAAIVFVFSISIPLLAADRLWVLYGLRGGLFSWPGMSVSLFSSF